LRIDSEIIRVGRAAHQLDVPLRVPAGHEGGEEPDTTGGTRRFDVCKYVGGHKLCGSVAWREGRHGGAAGQIEIPIIPQL
jgi:hypothetical protein